MKLFLAYTYTKTLMGGKQQDGNGNAVFDDTRAPCSREDIKEAEGDIEKLLIKETGCMSARVILNNWIVMP